MDENIAFIRLRFVECLESSVSTIVKQTAVFVKFIESGKGPFILQMSQPDMYT